jgi:hypothetical protein
VPAIELSQGTASRKTRILDKFVAVTGMQRKAAIRRLCQQDKPTKEQLGWQKTYTDISGVPSSPSSASVGKFMVNDCSRF